MRRKDVLTTGQVAQLCNVAPRTVTKWFDSGQLGGYRIPGSKDRRIPMNELIRFMKAHDIPTDAVEKGKLRILLIDSRVEHAQSFADLLRFDAGLMALKFSPNIILIDLLSNDIDSGRLCEYIQQCEELADCTLIALAGGLSDNEVKNLKHQGFASVVTEPTNLNAILSSIQQSCNILH
ncbi:MAG: helix-turn-helix domain-containing protein [Planctomycetota bacterium]|jgi:excisionase family DNA binding protein